MSLFFESIKLKDGKLELLEFHESRMKLTREKHCGILQDFILSEIIKYGYEYNKGLFKVRVDYDIDISNYTITPYEIKTHQKIILLENPDLQYIYKYNNRKNLNFNHALADDCIYTKNGFLTDASYSNLALYDGNEWFTPKNCLFEGIKRAYLLNEKLIHKVDIHKSELKQFKKIAFINAMRDFEKIYTFVIEDNYLKLNLI